MFRSLILQSATKQDATVGDDVEDGDENVKKRKGETDAASDNEVSPKKPKSNVIQPLEETDALPDTRAALSHQVGFDSTDATLNVVPTGGNLLVALTEAGMQYLIAGARANVGIKAGRYMYEARVVESLNPEDPSGNAGRKPHPRQIFRVGFSLKGSDLIQPQDAGDGVFFDSEGHMLTKGEKSLDSGRWQRGDVIGIVLNLTSEGHFANTISLFRNGERVVTPQALPDSLQGQTLFPHLIFRGYTLMFNFGPHPLRPLLFTCNFLQSAAKVDTTVVEAATTKDGKYEVVFPICFPDQGTFRWVDAFLKEKPHYVELSERKLVDWAKKSGVLTKNPIAATGDSNDAPAISFCLQSVDELSMRQMARVLAPCVPRNYVVLQVEQNLLQESRMKQLSRFDLPCYKKVARVMMGEPSDEYKKHVQNDILEMKQQKAFEEWQGSCKATKAAEKEEEEMAEVEEEMAEATDMGEEKEEEPAEDDVVDEKPENTEEGDESMAPDPDAEEIENPDAEEIENQDSGLPVVELSPEESVAWFHPVSTPDLTLQALSRSLLSFSLPAAEENFDEVSFEWQNAEKSQEFLRARISALKQTMVFDHIVASVVFKELYGKWVKAVTEWQGKLKMCLYKEYKAKQQTTKLLKPKVSLTEDVGESGMGGADDADQPEDATAPSGTVDIFEVEDICDVGDGKPLFVNFKSEDWELLNLRYELFLMMHIFRKEIGDDECVGIHEQTVSEYYLRFYRRALQPKHYGMGSLREVLDLIKNTVVINEVSDVLATPLKDDIGPESLDMFVRLTEESRTDREYRLSVGDESARISFSQVLQQGRTPQQPAPRGILNQAAASSSNIPRKIAVWKPGKLPTA